MNIIYVFATIAFSSLGVLLTGIFMADLLDWIIKNFSDDIEEIPAEKVTEPCIDEFENLYMNVANGDIFDHEYWLESVKRGNF